MKKVFIFILASLFILISANNVRASCFEYVEGVTPCYSSAGDFLCSDPQGQTQCCTESKYECNPESYCATNGTCVPTNFICSREYPKAQDCKDQGLKCGSSCKAPSGTDGTCKCTDVGVVTGDFCVDGTEPRCDVYNDVVAGCTCVSPSSNSPRGNVDLKCPGDSTGINTAIGCIHVIGDKNAAINDILKWAIGVGSGVAFLLMLYAGFMVMTASGNPERLKAGQELLTSAIAGLILLIFSVFILKFIGVDLLCLCKFGFGTTCPASCLQ